MHQLHRQKLCEALNETDGNACDPREIVFLRGASVAHRYGTDFEYPFRQESNFLYLTGVQEPDFQMVLVPSTGEYHLLIPRRDAMYAVWMGFVHPQEAYLSCFAPDKIHYTDEIESLLRSLKPNIVHCCTDVDADFVQKLGYKGDTGTLNDALAYCRVIKSDYELDELRKASKVANEAHISVMRSLKPGMMEYETMALYNYECTRRGLRHQPYSGIHAGGTGAAVLHYVDNNREIKNGDLYLIDAGAESNGYAADITRTYPANGKFTDIQAQIYDITLEMLETSLANARPGVEMENLQLDAARILVQRFAEAGFLKGSVDELMDKDIFALFFPHGLGHFLGLDTHDVGGYPRGVERIDRPGLRYLRARRLLEPGMVITIEPGIYFIPALLNPAFKDNTKSQYLNKSILSDLLGFGGIRIEDDVIITSSGNENMTNVPKTRKDIEKTMSEG